MLVHNTLGQRVYFTLNSRAYLHRTLPVFLEMSMDRRQLIRAGRVRSRETLHEATHEPGVMLANVSLQSGFSEPASTSAPNCLPVTKTIKKKGRGERCANAATLPHSCLGLQMHYILTSCQIWGGKQFRFVKNQWEYSAVVFHLNRGIKFFMFPFMIHRNTCF